MKEEKYVMETVKARKLRTGKRKKSHETKRRGVSSNEGRRER